MRKTKIFLFIAVCLATVSAQASKDIYVVHFILDGLRQDVLYQELNAGKIPNLKKYVFDKGASFKEAITVFPTVSSPGYVSFTTGLGAAKSGIFFLEWFDRSRNRPVGYMTADGYDRINVDFLNRLRLHNPENQHLYAHDTLFEKLEGIKTASIYSPFRIGADVVKPSRFPFKALWNGILVKDGLKLNQTAMRDLQRAFHGNAEDIPRYTLVGLFGTDLEGHQNGPDATEVVWGVRDFDREFGQFVAQLEKKGVLEKTYFVITSDHGMHKTGKKIDLPKTLKRYGLGRMAGVYATNRGVSAGFLYVTGDEGWKNLPTLHRLQYFKKPNGEEINLVEILLAEQGLEWVVTRNDSDKIRIFTSQGQGDIQRVEIDNHLFYSYRFEGKDPLGYADNGSLKNMLTGKPFPPRQWLQSTLQEKHPNAVVFLSELFQDPRSGDILVTTTEDYSFRSLKKGTHGSLSQGDLKIPLWVAGPDIPHGEFGEAQGVDLFPTILNWFGLEELATHQEGKFLFAQPKATPTDHALETLVTLENRLTQEPELLRLLNRDRLEKEIQSAIPAGQQVRVLEKLNAEIELRYSRWKKLEKFEGESKMPENPLHIADENKKNIDWLMATEKNIEFQRLRRLETIKQLLEQNR